jgi:hypothetical protein
MNYKKNMIKEIEFMEEKELRNFLKAQEGGKKTMTFVSDFTCKRNDKGKWEIAFIKQTKDDPRYAYTNFMNYKVALKKGEIVRDFPRLYGVEKFMKKICAPEFKVIMK